MKVVLVSKWVMPFGYGITLGHWLLVRKDSSNLEYVIAHEKIHWRQWQVEGSYFKWLFKYMHQVIKYGYRDCPYEVEARTMGAMMSRRDV